MQVEMTHRHDPREHMHAPLFCDERLRWHDERVPACAAGFRDTRGAAAAKGTAGMAGGRRARRDPHLLCIALVLIK
jgi:hypothetical protein